MVLSAGFSSVLAQQTSLDVPVAQWSAVLPAYQRDLETGVESGLSEYVVDADFFPATGDDLGRIDAELRLAWINPAAEPADEIIFRLYANDARYRDGAMVVSDVEIDGDAVDPDFSVEDTVMTVPLDRSIAPGEQADLTLRWEATIPNDTVSGFGMFNHDTRTDTYTLDHWMPLLAGYDPANGFDFAPLSVNGDPVFSNVAFFDITVGDLKGLVLASTGVVTEESATDDRLRQTIVSGPTRNFSMAISANYEVVTGLAGETEVRSYFLPGHAERGAASVDWAIAAINLFNELIGPYPYKQFSIVEAELGSGAAGIEFPQIVFMASDYYDDSLTDEPFPRGQEFTVVHEVLHQWWYGVVGNNQHQHAFLDESLTNYLTIVYFERIYGEMSRSSKRCSTRLRPYVIYLYGMSSGPQIDEPIDTPTDSFSTGTAYGVIIYNKGPLAFQAIREAMGDEPFFAALAAYYDEHRLQIAQPDDLYAALDEEAPPELDFAALWRHWIEEAHGNEDFPPALLVTILEALRVGEVWAR